MRACGSGAQTQPGEAQMRHGTGDRKTAGDLCPCDCHVGSGAESPQDSVCHFALAYITDGYFPAQGKMDHCSVNINQQLLQIMRSDGFHEAMEENQ